MLAATVSGFFLGLSLIVAIGAQNAFVLRQGLLKSHVFAICLTCALSDALLIAAGVSGFAGAADALPYLVPLLRYGGAAFLLIYGLRSFRSAFGQAQTLAPADATSTGLSKALATCLALTWLNPHVYLDTVVLLGSISTRFAGHELYFGLGATTASFVFFFSLGYGARLLRPVFARPLAWRILDGAIALIMWSIAARLVLME
ncbi:LysE/ArgO family amino acid transporter [Rhizobium sp. RU36D]|uniref:LysE/ArgO family amino acid transporter n=1 Tax=Rhizobium sp. RU36D TaxID=1907415 RepID=UPI0009D7B3D5|nr:LysE/ArgO family amino acid transporter [Rhizobium sp. RU36D]SMC60552.1 L-lysine exporter family protein LysE/ArgO [Rhizobium sp. RU36D]